MLNLVAAPVQEIAAPVAAPVEEVLVDAEVIPAGRTLELMDFLA